MMDFLNATHGLPVSIPLGLWFMWKIWLEPTPQEKDDEWRTERTNLMTNEQKTEAPERILARPVAASRDWTDIETGPWALDDPYGNAIDYTRTDLSQVAIGAAVERCAEVAKALLEEFGASNLFDPMWVVGDILTTAPEAVKAFEEHEARHKAELEAVLRKAAGVIDDPDFTQEDVDYVDNAHKWVLLEEAQTAILALTPQPSALDELLAEAKAEGVREAIDAAQSLDAWDRYTPSMVVAVIQTLLPTDEQKDNE